MAGNKSTAYMKDINQYLVCSLCGGYYIDATTIMECLHSFCKTCIVRYLETSNYCPKCDVQVHKTRPLLNIRPDLTLQDLVYKLVPGLLTNEMKKRREFYSVRPPAGENEDRQTAHERKLMAEEDKISIALEFSPDGQLPPRRRRRYDDDNDIIKEEEKKPENALDCRYLLCPSDFTIAHIKKFIRMKFGLASDLAIDVFRDFEPLGERYTLLDLAYMYLWRKRSPFKLFYSVYVTGDRARRRKLEQADRAEEPAQKKLAASPPASTAPALPTSTPAAATSKPATPSSSAQAPMQPATSTPDAKQPASKTPPAGPSSSAAASSAVPMSSAPRTVINKSPLQMKIVAPTERATSVKTSSPQQQTPQSPAKTAPSNGKPPVTKLMSQESQARPGQAMILPVRLPLSAMMGPAPSTSATSPVAGNNNNKPLTTVPRSPITAQHQLPKQVTRDSELKAAHKAHAHKPLGAKIPLAIPTSPGHKSPIGQNGQKLPNDYRSLSGQTGQKSPTNGQKSPTNGQKYPTNGQKSPITQKPELTHGSKNYLGSKSPPKTGAYSPTKEKEARQPHSPSAGSSGTLKTVLPLPRNNNSPTKGNANHGGNGVQGNGKSPDQAKTEPKVPPLRIPISRTEFSRDLAMHHAPIRRPILQHILPKKPKKKETNKSKVDLLQARFARNPNGQTLFMNKVHQTTHRATPSSASGSGVAATPRPPTHLLIPKPAHMNDNPSPQMHGPAPIQFQTSNHAHSAASHNSPGTENHGDNHTGSHSPTEEQDVPLDLQTPKTVKVS